MNGSESTRRIDWAEIRLGALVGVALLAAASIAISVIDQARDDFDGSGFQQFFLVLLFAAFAVAGSVGARPSSPMPLAAGALSGLGALAAWVPVRVLIWLVRDDDRGLVSGNEAVITLGSVFGFVVIATAFGMLGAFARSRRERRRRVEARPDPRPDEDPRAA